MFVPTALLKQLYTFNSLENTDQGVQFSIKNRLTDATLTELLRVKIAGTPVPLDDLQLITGDGDVYEPGDISKSQPLDFPLRRTMTVVARGIGPLEPGKYGVELAFRSKPFGKLDFAVEDAITEDDDSLPRIPRSSEDDYSEAIIKERQHFAEDFTGKALEHVKHYSYDPHSTKGNIENFVGSAQIPLGLAGPLTVNGEHAQGDFLIPLATSEGTLVASYNRGIKLCNLSGGIKATVVADCMQRAPVFVFNDARETRDFVQWVRAHMDTIREEAEATSSVAKLLYIDEFQSNRFAYLRFNYETGDAAGQNMVGRATFAACGWIIDAYPKPIQHFYLESNFATDKKASQVNVMRTRGKRVTAEAVIDRDVLIQTMRVEPESLHYHCNVATVGAFLSGAHNNGAHSPNAITAMFIATGQDVANVSESSAGVLYSELTDDGDLYVSLTIPSLIVATYGGGTGLATQRECLELMGCYGKNKVKKFAEIVASVALAGELSLGSAISSSDWVSSHESYGRNR
ncbi:hydroxymethylglutaryl-CoA reductase [Salisaeta longa]|uniref:hydroxymethylglutaryl-CoA reductase n=1 Tax=Salisaeta longa TaxID=503170 RepID=UPI0003B6943F|nr:hydroxymethylglutaryl-CoA reductase [Salisaeta longa]